MSLLHRFMVYLGRHRIIMDRDGVEPYLSRYYIFLKNRGQFLFNIFIHKFIQSDPYDLHDHPWAYISIPLWPGYWEFTLDSSQLAQNKYTIIPTKEEKNDYENDGDDECSDDGCKNDDDDECSDDGCKNDDIIIVTYNDIQISNKYSVDSSSTESSSTTEVSDSSTNNLDIPQKCEWRGPFSIRYREAESLHRIELPIQGYCWSIFIPLRRCRNWGFKTKNGWISEEKYKNNKNNINI